MPSSKFFVTYAVMTTEAGANPFWHSLILMSEQPDEDSPIEVKHAFGFYSTYPSSTTNPIINFLKDLLGFKIDLQDSHGHLQLEKLRYLDGQGLQGTSFDVSEEKYRSLIDSYQTAQTLEIEAIKQYNELLKNEGMVPNGYTRYLKEKIFVSEGTSPQRRLFPFHIDWGFSWNFSDFGFFTSKSYTCKSRALELLRHTDIVDDDFVKGILGTPAAHAFPRYSSLSIPPIQLISTGPRAQHKTPDTKVHYSRAWEDGNQLFWAHAPRLFDAKRKDNDLHDQDHEYQLLRNMSKQIDDIELLLLKKKAGYEQDNNSTSTHYGQCARQLARIMDIRKSLRVTNHNQRGDSLASRLVLAEKTLNTARMTLTPEKMNYTFLDRAIENIALHDAFMGLIAIIAAANLLTGVAAIAIAVSAGAYSAYQFYKAVETELATVEVMRDYADYLRVSNSTTTSFNGILLGSADSCGNLVLST